MLIIKFEIGAKCFYSQMKHSADLKTNLSIYENIIKYE